MISKDDETDSESYIICLFSTRIKIGKCLLSQRKKKRDKHGKTTKKDIIKEQKTFSFFQDHKTSFLSLLCIGK